MAAAPDIAGKGLREPAGADPEPGDAAALFSFDLQDEAGRDRAPPCTNVLASGLRTGRHVMAPGCRQASVPV